MSSDSAADIMQVDQQQSFQNFDPQLLNDINEFRHRRVISTLEGTNLHKLADTFGATLLHCATADGNHHIMKHLIKMGSSVNAQDQYGTTPLMLALQKDRFWTIKILLEAGADIYMENSEGHSALRMILHEDAADCDMIRLFFEVVKRDFGSVEEIVKVMSSVDCPIYHAALWTNVSITKSRVDAGWCVNRRNPNDKKTALHVAVRLGDLESVKYLLDNAAKVNLKDGQGRTPLSYVNPTDDSDSNLEILRLLVAHRAVLYRCHSKDRMQIYKILRKGVPKVVRALLECGIRLTRKDELGNTPVHYLAMNENEGSIDELRGMKFDADFQGDAGCTPLQIAVGAGLVGNVRFLLDNGADVNRIDCNFMTPLFHTVMSNKSVGSEMEMRKECVELLLERGADATYEGNGFHTVFDMINSFQNYTLAKPIILHLVVKESIGVPISRVVLEKIESDPCFRWHLELYRREVRKMQGLNVGESVTFFKFLAESDRKIVGYARNQNVVKRLERMSAKRTSKNHCQLYLKKRIVKAIRTAQVKQQAANAVSNVVRLGKGRYDDVVERIAGYLNDRDVKNLLNVRM